MVAIKEKLFVADFLHCTGAAASLSHAGGGHAATCHVSPRCDGHHGVLISIQLETERRQHWLQLHWEDETPVWNTFNQSWLGTVNGFKTSKDQSGHSLAQLSTVNRFHSSSHFNQLVLRKFLSQVLVMMVLQSGGCVRRCSMGRTGDGGAGWVRLQPAACTWHPAVSPALRFSGGDLVSARPPARGTLHWRCQ